MSAVGSLELEAAGEPGDERADESDLGAGGGGGGGGGDAAVTVLAAEAADELALEGVGPSMRTSGCVPLLDRVSFAPAEGKGAGSSVAEPVGRPQVRRKGCQEVNSKIHDRSMEANRSGCYKEIGRARQR